MVHCKVGTINRWQVEPDACSEESRFAAPEFVPYIFRFGRWSPRPPGVPGQSPFYDDLQIVFVAKLELDLSSVWVAVLPPILGEAPPCERCGVGPAPGGKLYYSASAMMHRSVCT
jgi:hypothetical protein